MMLIQVLLADSTEQMIREYQGASPESDLVELRLDRVRDLDVPTLLSASGKARVATCRSRSQGGFFGGTQEERRGILEEAVRHGAEYVDLEFDTSDADLLSRIGNSRPILSHHLRGSTPVNLEEIYRRMADRGGDAILKLVPYADSCTDNLRIRTLLGQARSEKRMLIAFCMGEKGKISRILSGAWGSWAVYAPATPDAQTAPGQLLLSELAGIYRTRELEESTPLCGVLGHPLSGSLSPWLHNQAYARLGIKRCFLPFETEGVAEFLPLLSELPISGLAVTHPHKETMLSHCDEVDPLAQKVGAVNTVVRRWNRLVGYNTDVEGGVAPLRALVPLKGARVGILGSGGAARALGFGLSRQGAAVTLFARNRTRVSDMARDLGCRCEAWDRAKTFKGQILINATPVGMHPGPRESPVPWEGIQVEVACDLVYNPVSTRFLQEGARSGARTLSGIHMFLEQALLQFEILAGVPASRALFEEILSAHLQSARDPAP